MKINMSNTTEFTIDYTATILTMSDANSPIAPAATAFHFGDQSNPA